MNRQLSETNFTAVRLYRTALGEARTGVRQLVDSPGQTSNSGPQSDSYKTPIWQPWELTICYSTQAVTLNGQGIIARFKDISLMDSMLTHRV